MPSQSASLLRAKDHEMELVTTVPEDAELYSLMPHMHFRGKRMKFTAQYPDGSEELLLSVPAYSFNWQLAHELEVASSNSCWHQDCRDWRIR